MFFPFVCIFTSNFSIHIHASKCKWQLFVAIGEKVLPHFTPIKSLSLHFIHECISNSRHLVCAKVYSMNHNLKSCREIDNFLSTPITKCLNPKITVPKMGQISPGELEPDIEMQLIALILVTPGCGCIFKWKAEDFLQQTDNSNDKAALLRKN